MLSLYEILKASKTGGIATDMWTALAGMNWSGAGSGTETKEITGIPPLSIRSNGTMLLDYLISGNIAQAGTPTPDNPIMPQGTGERMGNVMPAGELKTVESNGVTFSSDGKGKYTINGTATAYTSVRFYLLSAFTTPISVSNGGQGTLSFFNTSADNNVSFVFFNGTTRVDDWKQVPIRRTTTAYNTIGNKYVDSVVITVRSGATVDITITPEFTNDGVLPETFEKFGYKIPISSASTTTPVYLGEVESTRRIKKLVLTGQESTWTASGEAANVYYVSLAGDEHKATAITTVCTHFKSVRNATNYLHLNNGEMCLYSGTSSSVHTAGFKYPNSSLSDFKSYLAAQYAAGTPVTVWYVLATEKTGIVNEPLRKIGNFADTLSMEQAGVQIPTNRGNTVIDVMTELKPSEMYIKYQK